ncbi:MAG: hypothetical protein ACOVNZ_08985, partial [Crocinitomicaceae bacterium]
SGTTCPFASSFQSIQQFEEFSPLCIDAMEQSCTADLNATESACVSWMPNLIPPTTSVPTMVPTTTPSINTTTPAPFSSTPSVVPLNITETLETTAPSSSPTIEMPPAPMP